MSPDTLPPVIRRLLERDAVVPVDEAGLAGFLEHPGDQVLFLSGDPVQFPEGLDVAVVLPELRSASGGAFRIGVVARDDQEAVAKRYGNQRWPALVFVRDGRYVTTLAGMHDWSVFVERVAAALAAPTTRPPIALVGPAAASSCH
ncbi:MAG: hydrogenase [Piscinibacter sp.]|uniref:hydrogenase n=1 Tax=Piscinibacter sp. TaxID=1903157 RepID=UPI00258E3182|nr:hydrogenase [Piscinibacter sp.]MCW5667159.1 hydrogenase [Piscinibacter sp.]